MKYRDIPAAVRTVGSRSTATAKQLCALDVVVRLWFELGRPPTHSETCSALQLASSGRASAIVALERKGYLKRDPPRAPLSLTLKGCSALRMSHS